MNLAAVVVSSGSKSACSCQFTDFEELRTKPIEAELQFSHVIQSLTA